MSLFNDLKNLLFPSKEVKPKEKPKPKQKYTSGYHTSGYHSTTQTSASANVNDDFYIPIVWDNSPTMTESSNNDFSFGGGGNGFDGGGASADYSSDSSSSCSSSCGSGCSGGGD